MPGRVNSASGTHITRSTSSVSASTTGRFEPPRPPWDDVAAADDRVQVFEFADDRGDRPGRGPTSSWASRSAVSIGVSPGSSSPTGKADLASMVPHVHRAAGEQHLRRRHHRRTTRSTPPTPAHQGTTATVAPSAPVPARRARRPSTGCRGARAGRDVRSRHRDGESADSPRAVARSPATSRRGRVERLVEVGPEVVDVLAADAEADQRRRDPLLTGESRPVAPSSTRPRRGSSRG